jgi:hypothetical protein
MSHPPQALIGGDHAWCGRDERALFSHVDPKQRVPARHPLRKIRQVVHDVLASLDVEFAAL